MADRTGITIATDANVLINFIHIDQLELLGALPDTIFVIPGEVVNEITDSVQAAALQKAFAAGHVHRTDLAGISELEQYSTLIRTLGNGESACLALARSRNWSLASDEKRLFRRTALAEVGKERIWTTPDIIVHAIQAEVVSVEEADHWKEHLSQNRFHMQFCSLAELL